MFMLNQLTGFGVLQQSGAGASVGKGYIAAGYTTAASALMNSLTFDTESAIALSAALATARYFTCGVNSSTNGYFAGGTGVTNEIDGILFADESAVNYSAALTTPRQSAAGLSSSSKGYICGGNAGTTYYSDVEGINFTTHAQFNPVGNLAYSRTRGKGGNSSTKGYIMTGYGWFTATASNAVLPNVSIFTFSTETGAQTGNVIGNARNSPATGFNSSTHGYCSNGDGHAETNRVEFSTDTFANTYPGLPFVDTAAGVNSDTKGYVCGGYRSGSVSATVDSFTFATSAVTAGMAALSTGMRYSEGVQSGGYL